MVYFPEVHILPYKTNYLNEQNLKMIKNFDSSLDVAE